jgi:hypothetical protein
MKNFYKIICSALISCMIILPVTSHARLVSTEQATSNPQNILSHEKTNIPLSRGEVIKKFENLGLTSQNAQERVNAMTQDEINIVAKQMDSLPAGGYITETGGVIIGVTLIIIIALITQRK